MSKKIGGIPFLKHLSSKRARVQTVLASAKQPVDSAPKNAIQLYSPPSKAIRLFPLGDKKSSRNNKYHLLLLTGLSFIVVYALNRSGKQDNSTHQDTISAFFASLQHHYPHDSSIKTFIEHNLTEFTEHCELNFLLTLLTTITIAYDYEQKATHAFLTEILNGSHMKFMDNGDLYQQLTTEFNLFLGRRISSHQSIMQQFSLTGNLLRECLMGVSIDEEGNKSTWIQAERHSTKNIYQWVGHIGDYLKYLYSSRNIGPYGTSAFTEKSPLIFKRAHQLDSLESKEEAHANFSLNS